LYTLNVKALIWIESFAIVGTSSPDAEIPFNGNSKIKTGAKDKKTSVETLVVFKATS
jgi:hypothetical protein